MKDSPDIVTKDLSRLAVDSLYKLLSNVYKKEQETIKYWKRRAKQTNSSLTNSAMEELVVKYQAVQKEQQKLREWLEECGRTPKDTAIPSEDQRTP